MIFKKIIFILGSLITCAGAVFSIDGLDATERIENENIVIATPIATMTTTLAAKTTLPITITSTTTTETATITTTTTEITTAGLEATKTEVKTLPTTIEYITTEAILTEFVATETTIVQDSGQSSYNITDWEYTLLCRIVSSEYGSDWVPIEEKAKIVASVMAMVENPNYPNTIEGCLDVACVPWGFNKYKDYYMSDSIYAAVDYYFTNKNTVFAEWSHTSWWGDGTSNHFYSY